MKNKTFYTKKSHKKEKNARKVVKCCNTCANCIPIGEGDHICDEMQELVLEEYMPTDSYYICGGRYYDEL